MDHPRSRGVYRFTVSVPSTGAGSSPLARGLRSGGCSRHSDRRIIPARAGFTEITPGPNRSRGDHPRSRGVYPSAPPCSANIARIIPARAGFTRSLLRRRRRRWDHPRSRGVYYEEYASKEPKDGSSPLARGLLPGHSGLPRQERIIPARAGFTRRACTPSSAASDHPRSRGVYMRAVMRARSARGSSPLARGLRDLALLHGLPERIIPARAGFTRRRP